MSETNELYAALADVSEEYLSRRGRREDVNQLDIVFDYHGKVDHVVEIWTDKEDPTDGKDYDSNTLGLDLQLGLVRMEDADVAATLSYISEKYLAQSERRGTENHLIIDFNTKWEMTDAVIFWTGTIVPGV